MLKKILYVSCVVLYFLCTGNALMGMEQRGNPLESSVSVRTYHDDIRDHVSVLAQPDALEFCEKMHGPLLQWATNHKNPNIKNWSSFFLYAIFQKEMNLTATLEEPIDIDTALKSLFADNKKINDVASKKITAMFSTVTKKNIINTFHVDTSVFYHHLNKNASFKKIKGNNAYAQFVSGFLQLVQGIQTSDEQTMQEGRFQLTMSAFGLCTISLDVLQTIKDKQNKTLCQKIIENLKISKKSMDDGLVNGIIEKKIFFDYQHSLFFTRLMEKHQNHMIDIMNNRFNRFVTIAYDALTADQQELYKGMSDFLRRTLIAKRDAAFQFSSVSWTLNIIVPFVTSLVGGIITLFAMDYQSDQKNSLIAGGSVSLIGPVFNLLYGFSQWYNAVHIPTYCEKQIQLIALYFATSCTTQHVTAEAISQQFIDYLDDKYDDKITLSQNALNHRKTGIKK